MAACRTAGASPGRHIGPVVQHSGLARSRQPHGLSAPFMKTSRFTADRQRPPPCQFRPMPLELIEVQLGDCLGEDDIEHLSDQYGRN
jgi:hypothetical protein